MEKLESIADLEFRDISSQLREGTLDYIKINDIIKGINIRREGEYDNKEHTGIYHFISDEYGIEGRIFPFDEIVYLTKAYDIIVQNFGYKKRRLYIDAQIYHELKEGEEIPVRVSRKDFEKDPSFKLFHRIGGFIKDSGSGLYKRINVGSKVLVKVDNIWAYHNKIHIATKPIKFL